MLRTFDRHLIRHTAPLDGWWDVQLIQAGEGDPEPLPDSFDHHAHTPGV